MIRIAITLIAGLAMLGATFAFAAEPLKAGEVDRFVDTLPEVQSLGDALEAQGKNEAMQLQAQPKPGEPFKPYSSAVAALKTAHPGEHAKLKSIVSKKGFSTEEWAAVGDRVIVAYMAIKMKEQDPRTVQMMDGMDQSMIDMMPPEMQEQMKAAFAMMETVKNAPEADQQAIMPSKEKLDAFMETQGRGAS